ncbi:MAG: Gfo/Idh/MocA family oxidoreductase [Candidatus Aminicenantes bacterium]|nr:MAG: Gfo/Idh/MocA family oxidoreductase [Candidatus Aminicenantes bacterium]
MKQKGKGKGIQPVSVVLVGITGMGQPYLETLLAGFSPGEIDLKAVIEPYPERSAYKEELKDRGIPVLDSFAQVIKGKWTPDLLVVCSPIHHHVPQASLALEHGSHVLCEKPIGATIQDATRLIRIMNQTKVWVMIGYQWSYSRAIQSLKSDIMSGKFGKPLRMRTLCCWPRDEAYYKRNNWAGKIKDSQGNWVLDSPANNAMSHFLHNLFYTLGEKTDGCAMPFEVTAELYRTYPIENYDTVACRAFTRDGVEILFYASHTTSGDLGPMFFLEFEHATVTYGEAADDIIAKDKKGNTIHYGSPEAEHPLLKLFEAVRTIQEPRTIFCGPEASIAQTLCMNGIQESVSTIIDFPDSKIDSDHGCNRRWVKHLLPELENCYKRAILPSEAGLDWASSGKPVNLGNYRQFPGGR